jgi:hypothetical protein
VPARSTVSLTSNRPSRLAYMIRQAGTNPASRPFFGRSWLQSLPFLDFVKAVPVALGVRSIGARVEE